MLGNSVLYTMKGDKILSLSAKDVSRVLTM